jgi:signal transduction histidine kinase
MNFRNLKLGTKQLIGFGIVLVIMAGANIFTVRNMKDIKSGIDEVSTNWLPRGNAVADININTTKLRLNQLQLALATDEEIIQKEEEILINLIDRINENLDTYEALKTKSVEKKLYSDEERQIFSEFDSNWDGYQELSFTFFALLNENKREEAVKLLNEEARQVFNEMGNNLEALVNVTQNNALNAANLAENKFFKTRNFSIIILVVTIAISIVLAGALVRYITIPIRNLEQAAGKVSEGDLEVELDILSKDEIGSLSLSFNEMTKALSAAREKTEEQAAKLRKQAEELKLTNTQLEQKNSDLERAMEQLRASQEQLVMREKMAGLGNLVAGVAHEINNPIGTVKSSTDVSHRCVEKIEIVLEKISSLDELKNNPNLPKTFKILKNNINVTLIAGERVAMIVKSLKNFARLDESDYQRADIHEGIDSSLTLLENELRGRVKVAKSYGDLPKIGCYPGQLNQAFMNLLINASQAIENRGSINIKTERENGNIVIKFSDTGRGIPKEKLKKIFDFSFSVAGERIKMSSGLSTAYNIVQKHKGDMMVESEVGKGTTVKIILPVK